MASTTIPVSEASTQYVELTSVSASTATNYTKSVEDLYHFTGILAVLKQSGLTRTSLLFPMDAFRSGSKFAICGYYGSGNTVIATVEYVSSTSIKFTINNTNTTWIDTVAVYGIR